MTPDGAEMGPRRGGKGGGFFFFIQGDRSLKKKSGERGGGSSSSSRGREPEEERGEGEVGFLHPGDESFFRDLARIRLRENHVQKLMISYNALIHRSS